MGALVRPGRLDRIVMVGLPNHMERMATLQIHARKLQTENLDFDALARCTRGRSGADLANLLNEAALLAARRRADAVRMEHINEVLRNPRPQQQRNNQGFWNPERGEAGSPPAETTDAGMPYSPEVWARMLQAFAASLAAGYEGPGMPQDVPDGSRQTGSGPVIEP